MDKQLPGVGLKYRWGSPKLSHLDAFVVTSVDPESLYVGDSQIYYTYENGYKASMPASFWFSDEAQPAQVN